MGLGCVCFCFLIDRFISFPRNYTEDVAESRCYTGQLSMCGFWMHAGLKAINQSINGLHVFVCVCACLIFCRSDVDSKTF